MHLPRIVVLSGAFLLGILLCAHLSFEGRVLDAVAIVIVCVYATLFEKQVYIAATVLTIIAGAGYGSLREAHVPIVNETRTLRFAGLVVDRQESDVTAKANDTLLLDNGLSIRVLLPLVVSNGDRVIVRGRLTPFDVPRNPGEPDMRILEREQGLDAQIESPNLIAHSPSSHVPFRVTISRWRASALAEFQQRLGEPAASILAGELWGAHTTLPPDLRDDFQDAGTVHVLVTAGLHVGLIAMLVTLLLGLLPLHRTFVCAGAIAAVWCFVVWSGMHLPAERAATMISFALLARSLGRATLSIHALALAAFAVALLRPESVATASFALSFACVAAIFAYAKPIARYLREHTSMPALASETIALTIASQLGTWPITAAVFLQFSPYALLANLAVVPCVPMTMILGIGEICFTWCAPLAQAFANMNGWLLAWMIGVTRAVGQLPWHHVIMTPAPAWCIVLYLLAILGAPMFIGKGRATFATACVILTTSLLLWPPIHDEGVLRITAIDVGQADALLVQTPAGHALLVDSGGRLERSIDGQSQAEQIGERIVVPFLIRQGVHALDALIITHPHGEP